MKKGLLFILMVGASVCLSAQEKGKTEGKAYTVETNRFGANWFISGGVGGQMYFGDNDGKATAVVQRKFDKLLFFYLFI